jgi:Glycosyl transferase family 2
MTSCLPANQLAPAVQDSEPADRDAITAIGIVIPARNEQAYLGRCLDAIRAAVTHLRSSAYPAIEIRTLVVLDSCTDRTADIARCYLEVETITADLGRVGAARALGARALLPTSTDRHRHLWLANTDADSAVPAHWLTHMIEDAHRGADLILGTVEPDATATPRLRHAWNVRHVAEDGHTHVHGANLGIRSSAYLGLGGWAHDASGEDASLVRAAAADGTVRTLRSGAIPVVTSGRLTGRAPHGFARYLQLLTHQIDHPASAGTTRSWASEL